MQLLYLLLAILVGLLVRSHFLLKKYSAKQDLQKYRKEYYWTAIDRIVETDDKTHARLVDFINQELYEKLGSFLYEIANEAKNSKTFDDFKLSLSDRKKQLDANYTLYRKKVAGDEQK